MLPYQPCAQPMPTYYGDISATQSAEGILLIHPVTRTQILCYDLPGESAVQFSGMNIAPGEALRIDMEPPIGAEFSDGENALPHAARFDFLAARNGPQSVSAALTYGSGTKGAKITIKARGRF